MEAHLDSEFQYKLKAPFRYAHKGETVEAKFVLLRAPTSKHRRECAVLKQAFFRALRDAPDAQNVSGADAAKREEVTGEEVMTLLAMSSNVDLDNVFEAGRTLLTGGVAMLDGEQKMTAPLLDEVSMDDLEGMLGEYLAFFTLRSALESLNSS